MNLIVFVSKPLFADIMRYCRNCACNYNTNVTMIGGRKGIKNSQCQRCTTIHKRPYVKWHKMIPGTTSNDTTSDRIEMDNVAQNVAPILDV